MQCQNNERLYDIHSQPRIALKRISSDPPLALCEKIDGAKAKSMWINLPSLYHTLDANLDMTKWIDRSEQAQQVVLCTK